jgi:TP901 family phage tail tape measure protein
MTGLTKDEAKVFGDAAIEMSKKYGTAAKDIVEGMKLIIGNKPELKDVKEDLIKVTDAALLLSKAAGMDLPDAAKRLTDAMNQFKIPASGAAKMVDMLAVAAKEGAAEIPDITNALLKFGAVAKNSNISLAESLAVIETLASRGLKGEEAGTPFRNIALKMDGIDVASKKALAELKQWGVNPLIVSNKELPLTTRLRELAKIQGDAGAMAKFFGVENVIAGTILLEETKLTDDLTTKIKNNTEAQIMANANTDNTIDKWNKVKTNVDAAILSFVNNSSAIKSLTDDLVNLSDKVGDGSGNGVNYIMKALDFTLHSLYEGMIGQGLKAVNALGIALNWLGDKLKKSQQSTMDLLGLKETPMDTILKKLGLKDDKKVTKEVGVEWFWENPDVLPGGEKKKETAEEMKARMGLGGEPAKPTGQGGKSASEIQKEQEDILKNKEEGDKALLDLEQSTQDIYLGIKQIVADKLSDMESDEARKRAKIQSDLIKQNKDNQTEYLGWLLTQKTFELEWEQKTLDEKLKFLSSYLSQSKDLFKENSIAYKLLASSQAAIDTAAAALSSYKSMAVIPVVGPTLGWIAAGIATAFGLKQIATINGVKLAEGVVDLQGPGTETSDSINARLSKGESVLTAKNTRDAKKLITGIHEGYIKDSDYIISNSNTSSTIFETKRLEEKLERQIEATEKMSSLVRKIGTSYPSKDGFITILYPDGSIKIVINK